MIEKILSLDEAKNKVKKTNLIIYSSIRNIEEHFAKSFSNIDKISDVFDNVLCIKPVWAYQNLHPPVLIWWNILLILSIHNTTLD